MINFVEKLQKEIRRKIDLIEEEDKNILKKSLDASHVLGNAFDRLKEFIIAYKFKDEAEEILFFKEIKPKISAILSITGKSITLKCTALLPVWSARKNT